MFNLPIPQPDLVRLCLSDYFRAAAHPTGCKHHVNMSTPDTVDDDLVQNSALGAYNVRNQNAEAVFSGRTFSSFFKEQHTGDMFLVDFGVSTGSVRLNLILAVPPRLVSSVRDHLNVFACYKSRGRLVNMGGVSAQ